MLRNLVMALFLAASSAGAEDFHDATVVGFVRGEDRAGLDAFLGQAQAAYLRNEISADQMRDLFIALSRSHQQTVRFVEAWADAAPENAFAQIARAWSLWTASDQMRGAGSAAAYAVFEGMRERAIAHAKRARAISPDLIPVSDAVLRMYRTDPTVGDPAAALEKVMATHPNWGSMMRVYPLVGPLGPDAIDGFCAHYGPLVTPDATPKCRMYGYTYYTSGYLGDFADVDGWDETDPDMVMLRIAGLTTKYRYEDLTDQQVAWMEEAILSFEADLYGLVNLQTNALHFANRVAILRRDAVFYERFKKAHLERAVGFLDVDPYNLDLLDMVEGTAFLPEWETVTHADGRTEYTTIYPEMDAAQKTAFRTAEAAQRVDFAGRRLMANPHDGDSWESYAMTVGKALDSKYFFDMDDAFENALVYGTSDPVLSLGMLLVHKTYEAELLGYRDTPSVAHIWDAIGRDIDVPNEVLCPFLRAHRLRQAMCDSDALRTWSCTEHPGYDQKVFDQLLAEAQAAPQCAPIRDADVETLWYTPVPMSDALVPVPTPARDVYSSAVSSSSP